ncbi:hypothetical protein L5515_015772 [Caenorhabditis briggsae]|uniref:Uncharacterized protein n=1 Tax=Caenorhabditis briggsae TaxID=6238 RepID=A0AAE9J970_CAEBR|nr:hypothetical protein L5515_015772 [Caenorhabditis briggsae]
MKTSEEYSSYWMKIIMLTGAMFVFSITGGLLAGAIRMIYLVKLNKSLIRAATNLHSAGQIMKKAILEPSVLAVIANERNGMDFNKSCEVYEKCSKKPIKLLLNLFGMDDLTKDFVKYYDSKFLKAKKKGKSKDKKVKTSKNSKK